MFKLKKLRKIPRSELKQLLTQSLNKYEKFKFNQLIESMGFNLEKKNFVFGVFKFDLNQRIFYNRFVFRTHRIQLIIKFLRITIKPTFLSFLKFLFLESRFFLEFFNFLKYVVFKCISFEFLIKKIHIIKTIKKKKKKKNILQKKYIYFIKLTYPFNERSYPNLVQKKINYYPNFVQKKINYLKYLKKKIINVLKELYNLGQSAPFKKNNNRGKIYTILKKEKKILFLKNKQRKFFTYKLFKKQIRLKKNFLFVERLLDMQTLINIFYTVMIQYKGYLYKDDYLYYFFFFYKINPILKKVVHLYIDKVNYFRFIKYFFGISLFKKKKKKYRIKIKKIFLNFKRSFLNKLYFEKIKKVRQKKKIFVFWYKIFFYKLKIKSSVFNILKKLNKFFRLIRFDETYQSLFLDRICKYWIKIYLNEVFFKPAMVFVVNESLLVLSRLFQNFYLTNKSKKYFHSYYWYFLVFFKFNYFFFFFGFFFIKIKRIFKLFKVLKLLLKNLIFFRKKFLYFINHSWWFLNFKHQEVIKRNIMKRPSKPIIIIDKEYFPGCFNVYHYEAERVMFNYYTNYFTYLSTFYKARVYFDFRRVMFYIYIIFKYLVIVIRNFFKLFKFKYYIFLMYFFKSNNLFFRFFYYLQSMRSINLAHCRFLSAKYSPYLIQNSLLYQQYLDEKGILRIKDRTEKELNIKEFKIKFRFHLLFFKNFKKYNFLGLKKNLFFIKLNLYFFEFFNFLIIKNYILKKHNFYRFFFIFYKILFFLYRKKLVLFYLYFKICKLCLIFLKKNLFYILIKKKLKKKFNKNFKLFNYFFFYFKIKIKNFKILKKIIFKYFKIFNFYLYKFNFVIYFILLKLKSLKTLNFFFFYFKKFFNISLFSKIRIFKKFKNIFKKVKIRNLKKKYIFNIKYSKDHKLRFLKYFILNKIHFSDFVRNKLTYLYDYNFYSSYGLNIIPCITFYQHKLQIFYFLKNEIVKNKNLRFFFYKKLYLLRFSNKKYKRTFLKFLDNFFSLTNAFSRARNVSLIKRFQRFNTIFYFPYLIYKHKRFFLNKKHRIKLKYKEIKLKYKKLFRYFFVYTLKKYFGFKSKFKKNFKFNKNLLNLKKFKFKRKLKNKNKYYKNFKFNKKLAFNSKKSKLVNTKKFFKKKILNIKKNLNNSKKIIMKNLNNSKKIIKKKLIKIKKIIKKKLLITKQKKLYIKLEFFKNFLFNFHKFICLKKNISFLYLYLLKLKNFKKKYIKLKRLFFSQQHVLQNLNFFLVIKSTKNNLFSYIYSNYLINFFIYKSNGISGYKGPVRSSATSGEKTGYLLGCLAKKLGVRRVIFLINKKLTKKIKECLKGIRRSNLFIKKIIVLPKIPHNGVRHKKQRRT